HVIVQGVIPSQNGRRDAKQGVEMYSTSRFFVMTGDHVEGTPRTIEQRQSVLSELFQEIFPERKNEAKTPAIPVQSLAWSDNELMEKASRAANGAKFQALLRGDFAGAGYGSHSEADAALLKELYFWTGADKERSFRLFSQSGLNRDKWDREDYREKTWAFVANGKTYSPKMNTSRATKGKTLIETTLDDPRPRVQLPGDNHLLSDAAKRIGEILAPIDIFSRGNCVFIPDEAGDRLCVMTPDMLRTWVEDYL